MKFTEEQIEELYYLGKHAPEGYIRVKALAVWNVASGRAQGEVSKFMAVSRVAVNQWVKGYLTEGRAAFPVRAGRGVKAKANKGEVENHLRQSPRQFGLMETRWTLRSLAAKVPCLKGFSVSGVYQALVRFGFRYKRGQPAVHSPDPLYDKKRGSWSRPSKRPERNRKRS